MRNQIFENGNSYIIAQGATFRKLPKLYRGLNLHVAFTEWSRELLLCYLV